MARLLLGPSSTNPDPRIFSRTLLSLNGRSPHPMSGGTHPVLLDHDDEHRDVRDVVRSIKQRPKEPHVGRRRICLPGSVQAVADVFHDLVNHDQNWTVPRPDLRKRVRSWLCRNIRLREVGTGVLKGVSGRRIATPAASVTKGPRGHAGWKESRPASR
jgi:hypothetical protein